MYPKTTDFIFAVVGEEMGFVACSSIIVLFIALITKTISIAKNAGDDLGSYIAAGIARSINISCSRKHWNDDGITTNNGCTTPIY